MSGGNGDIQNVVQDIEALRDRMDAQKAAIRTLEVNLDQRFWRLDQRFEEMINRFDALGVDANRNRNDGGQQPRDQLARGGVSNVPVAANVQNQVAGLSMNGGFNPSPALKNSCILATVSHEAEGQPESTHLAPYEDKGLRHFLSLVYSI
ncbi:hypothetical protein M9H77_19594 [Catharanthus roseus]|uniref:Uncharacterized protein n=1 Tax=Catharanthus roseus TaxID=4058 RepID=A0ACC0BAS0_CATRO|nr:hypothetical protein M9H77_19594 [Catharanthus roseus]